MGARGMSVAVVTGASGGIGAEIAVILAKRGYDLVLLNRSHERSQSVLRRLKTEFSSRSIAVIETDLADQDSITKAAQSVLEIYPRISLLFNNAGVLLAGHELSQHGNEMHFQINTLAPYLLMRLLKPALFAGQVRVMNVSSGSMAMTGKLRIDDLKNPGATKKLFGAYAQSKLALTTLTNGLAKEFEAGGVILRSADPGGTKTNMTRGDGMPTILRWLQPILFKSPQRAASDLVNGLLDAQHGKQSGIYLSKNRIRGTPEDATDPVMQKRLLALCCMLTGV
jgi:NAD(P)-dependent dehydrogenase (short-subunit alcohol dehydrogenase family)